MDEMKNAHYIREEYMKILASFSGTRELLMPNIKIEPIIQNTQSIKYKLTNLNEIKKLRSIKYDYLNSLIGSKERIKLNEKLAKENKRNCTHIENKDQINELNIKIEDKNDIINI